MAGKRLIVKVAGVGLLAGLIGGGVSYGVGNAIVTHQQNAATKVPSGSNKSGGTKINKNEDTKIVVEGADSRRFRLYQKALSQYGYNKVRTPDGWAMVKFIHREDIPNEVHADWGH